jgi:ATP-dependent DNA ligase
MSAPAGEDAAQHSDAAQRGDVAQHGDAARHGDASQHSEDVAWPAMVLPLSPPIQPQLALSRATLPSGVQYAYEIKLDGFRCIAFVDGERQFLQSRNGRSLSRYFPELVLPPGRYVLDGEIVVRGANGREDFDALGQRIHPAASRVNRLAAETPAVYVAFDLLAREDRSLLELPFAQRRAALEDMLASDAFRSALDRAAPASLDRVATASLDRAAPAAGVIELMPTVDRVADAERWLREAEGAIAKERSAPYLPGERRGMVKVKRVRTIDAVVRGWRPGKHEGTVGALILGLYDGDELREVGHCSGLRTREKRELVERLRPFQTGRRGSAEPSRWSAGRNLEWVELRPELVVEIDFDHVSAQRIRHGAKLRRWREDKDPRDCTIDQLAS